MPQSAAKLPLAEVWGVGDALNSAMRGSTSRKCVHSRVLHAGEVQQADSRDEKNPINGDDLSSTMTIPGQATGD